MPKHIATIILGLSLCAASLNAIGEPTYAERLGWPPGSRVVIFHIDDAGMCHDANAGAIEAIEKGAATSVSIMFPCAWVVEFARYLKKHPDVDAGAHLTLTSEWDNYRWGPVAGKRAVPGLVDEEGCFWDDVPNVIAHASADEVETEIRAQVDRAETLGIKLTHLDSHMGTLFESPEYFMRYMKLGIEKKIPVLIAGGHLRYILEGEPEIADAVKAMAQMAWAAGLPVLDDIHAISYDWKEKAEKKEKVIEFLRTLEPGITEFILHCTKPSNVFEHISTSGPTREADLLAMTDPEVKKVIEEEGIILTTWRELMQRRGQAE